MHCSLEEFADGFALVLGRRDGKGGCGDMNRIGVGERRPVECFCMLGNVQFFAHFDSRIASR